MANRIQIEDAGIEAVKRQLRSSSNIDATKLFHNDKTQSWDGDLFLYENEEWNKKELIGKIPTQVKARTVQKFSKQISSLSMSKADLRNYKNDGGVILFKVEIIGDKSKVFFNSLMPFDLEIILKRIKPAVESATISLNEMTLNDALSFALICKRFISDKIKQMPIVNFDFPDNEVKQIHIEGIVKGGTNLPEFLMSGEHYIYGKRHPDDELYQYVTKGKLVNIKEKHVAPVCLDGKEYYSSYEVKRTLESLVLALGDNINVVFCKDKKEVELQFRIMGNLKVILNDLNFILDLQSSKKLQIGNGYFPVFDSGISYEKKNELEATLRYYNKIAKVMDYFVLEHNEIDFTDITKEESNALGFLIDVIVNKEKITPPTDQQGKLRIKIGNIELIVFIYKTSEGEYVLKDVNEIANGQSRLLATRNDGRKEEIKSSVFVLLEADDIIKCKNVSPDKAINDIIKYDYHPFYVDLVNRLALNLIHVFDKTQNKDCLKYADELFDWIDESEFDDDLVTINKFQITARERSLFQNEKRILKKMLSKTNEQKKCGIFILLDEIKLFNVSFKKLDPKLQEEFKGYPIYKLMKK